MYLSSNLIKFFDSHDQEFIIESVRQGLVSWEEYIAYKEKYSNNN